MKLTIITIYIIISLKFIYPFLERYFGFPGLPWYTSQALIIGLFATIYTKALYSNRQLALSESKLKIYKFLFFALLAVIIFSALVNNNNFLFVLKSIFSYALIFILLFLVVIEMDMNEKQHENLIKFILLVLFVQIPITFLQYFFIGSHDADSNSGTISAATVGGTGILAVLMTFLLAYAVAQIFVKGFSIKRLLLALSTLFPVIAGGARVAIVLFPVTIIITAFSFYLIKENRKFTSVFKGIIIGFIILSTSLLIIFAIIPKTKYAKFLDVKSISSIQNIQNYDRNSGYNGSRILGYYIIFDSIFNNEFNVVLGMGNESVTQSKVAGMKNMELDFLANSPDAMIFLASNGFLGLLLILAIILLGVPIIKNYLIYESSQFMTILAYALIPFSFNVIASIFYTTTWSSQIGLIYWVLLGILAQRFYIFSKGTRLVNAIISNEKKIIIHQS